MIRSGLLREILMPAGAIGLTFLIGFVGIEAADSGLVFGILIGTPVALLLIVTTTLSVRTNAIWNAPIRGLVTGALVGFALWAGRILATGSCADAATSNDGPSCEQEVSFYLIFLPIAGGVIGFLTGVAVMLVYGTVAVWRHWITRPRDPKLTARR